MILRVYYTSYICSMYPHRQVIGSKVKANVHCQPSPSPRNDCTIGLVDLLLSRIVASFVKR